MCRTFGPPATTYLRRVVYDFAPQELYPIRRGPVMSERPRTGFARPVRELRNVITRARSAFEGCWKWASARGAQPTTLDVAFTIGPLGDVLDLAITGKHHPEAELLGCLRATYTPTPLTRVTPRTTRVKGTLAFTLADQPAWKQPPARPTAPIVVDARGHTICTPVLDAAPEVVTLQAPITISDFDEVREPTLIRRMRVGCAVVDDAVDKRSLLATIAANRGAFQRCYADARDRDPGLAGTIALHLLWAEAGGTITDQGPPPGVTGAGDDAFHACLVAAARELWLSPMTPGGVVEANVTFTLEPPATPTTVDAYLATGDPQGALDLLAAQLRRGGPPAEQCARHADVVRVMLARAPWLDDARVFGAFAHLATALHGLSPQAATECVARAEASIATFTRSDRREPRDNTTTTTWLARYAAVLPLVEHLPSRGTILWSYAEALALTDRRSEGLTRLHALTRDPDLGETIAMSLRRHGGDPDAVTCNQ